MSDRELMQQALEDIDTLFGLAINEVDGWARSATAEEIVMRLSALRARLAEPDDEPVGHVTVRRLSKRFENHTDQFVFYPAGQSPYLDNVDEFFAVYTRPAARKVQPLTNEQIQATARDAQIRFCLKSGGTFEEEFARAIERAHGITGDSHD